MIQIREMTAADLPTAMVLKTEAGWNQVDADWRRFLAMQPGGCFVAELDGQPVGTTVTCIFGDVAWVAMVLVAKRVRGQGIGTALMRHALEYLDAQQVPTVRLDATPLGRPIYEKLGFVEEYALARYEGVLDAVRDASQRIGSADRGQVRGLTAGDDKLAMILALDRDVTGTPREKLLSRLLQERPDAIRIVEDGRNVAAYLTSRPGSNAVQLGPCIGSLAGGAVLLEDAAERLRGQRVYLDIPERRHEMVKLAEQYGLTIQRKLLRMCRGPRVAEDDQRLLVSSGPELG